MGARTAGLGGEDLQVAEDALVKRARAIAGLGTEYTGLTSIANALSGDGTDLLKGSWLAGHTEDGDVLPRRQDLPSGALWAAAELLPKVAGNHEDTARLLWLSEVIAMWATTSCPPC